MIPQAESLLSRARATRARILSIAAEASPEELSFRPGARWSARDTLIHIANWEEQAVKYFGHLTREEQIPDSGFRHVDEQNAAMLAPHAGLDIAGVLAYMERVRAELESCYAAVTAEQFEANPSFPGLMLMSPDHELGHIHQICEAIAWARNDRKAAAFHYLGYARERIVVRLNLEFRPVAANEFPVDGVSIKDLLAGLALRDRLLTEGLARGEWEQPADRSVKSGGASLAAVLHDLGAARGALEAELGRLPATSFAEEAVWTWLADVRDHENKLIYQILSRLRAWREAAK